MSRSAAAGAVPAALLAVAAAALATLAPPAGATSPRGSLPCPTPSSPVADFRAYVHACAAAGHQRVRYSSTMTDTWDVLSLAEADPAIPGNVVTLYCDRSVPVASAGNEHWEREHVWPRSRGELEDTPCDFAFTDLHHLFPSERGINNSRGNLPFGYCQVNCVPKSCDGSAAVNRMGGGVWEVWPDRRGDVARALFYMDVRYDGEIRDGCREHDLVLTDNMQLIDNSADSPAHMGLLDDLLWWHAEDPVDDRERRRNDVVAAHQGNRNPFVDHPDWVCAVWPPCQVWLPAVGDITTLLAGRLQAVASRPDGGRNNLRATRGNE